MLLNHDSLKIMNLIIQFLHDSKPWRIMKLIRIIKDHPEFIENYKHLWATVIIYDAENNLKR